MNRVCVVIPVYKPFDRLTSDEVASISQCFRILRSHPVYAVGPKAFDYVPYQDFGAKFNLQIKVVSFSDFYFENVKGYNKLLLSTSFYKSFKPYKFMLIYQPDAWVFRDELEQWCSKGFDYIGAPWFEGSSEIEGVGNFTRGGNGGFSLRKIASHLKVLRSFGYVEGIKDNFRNRVNLAKGFGGVFYHFGGLLLDYTFRNNFYSTLNTYPYNEDIFWSLVVPARFPWFKVAQSEEAAFFSFEKQPRRLHTFTNGQLPFGCHAWEKYTPEFWQEFIENKKDVKII